MTERPMSDERLETLEAMLSMPPRFGFTQSEGGELLAEVRRLRAELDAARDVVEALREMREAGVRGAAAGAALKEALLAALREREGQ